MTESGFEASEHPTRFFELANSQVSIQLQGPGLALTLIQSTDTVDGLTGTAHDLYSIELTAPNGEKRLIGSSEASEASELREGRPVDCHSGDASTDQCLVLIFTHFPDSTSQAKLLVKCSIVLPRQSSSSDWRIEVENTTGYAIQKIKYPLVALAKPSVRPITRRFRYSYDWNVEYSSALLLGLYDGTLIPEPHENIPDGFGWSEEHPGRMAVQIMAYCDIQGGLCLYTRDGTGYPKLLGFERQGSNLDISPTHLFPREYGASVQVAYPVVLAPFAGDWTAAADIYKGWAKTQEWMRVPLSEQVDVPDWVKAGYPFFFYAQGRPLTTDPFESWKETLNLPRQMLPVLKAYEKLLDSPMVLMLYGWEKHCSWITPDVFPPYPSTEDIRYLAAGLKENGSRVCLLNSGTRWAVKNPRDPAWDGMEYWEKEGRQASCVSEDGQWSYDSRLWAVNHKLCIAAEGTWKMMDRYIQGFADLGVDATQYDQNLGGESYVCFSRQHGHPEGYGRWMYDESQSLLRRFLTESRKHNPDFATSVEEPNEVLIPNLSFYNGRPYIYHGWPMLTNMLCVGVPLFSYLYHEVAAGYGGDLGVALNGPESERIKIGRTVAAGYLVQVNLMSAEYGFSAVQAAVKAGQPEANHSEGALIPMPPALSLLKNATQASQTYGRDWMVLGQMRPAPQYEVGEFYELKKARAQSYYNDDRVEYLHPESVMVKVPVVLGSAWISPSGAPACVFINMSEKPQRIKILWSSLGTEWQTGQASKLALETLSATTHLAIPSMPEDVLVIELPGLQTGVLRPD